MAIRARSRVREIPAPIQRDPDSNLSTKEAILKAAEAEFAAHGFGGARADSIARRAGVNKALPFYHFGSKAELYGAVLGRMLEQLTVLTNRTMSESPPDFEHRLRSFIRGFFAYLAENPNWLKIIARELIDEGSRARAIARRHLRPMVRAGEVTISGGIARGGLREIEPLQMMVSISAEVVFYALITPFLEGVGMRDPMGQQNRARREEAVMAILTRGVMKPPPGKA